MYKLIAGFDGVRRIRSDGGEDIIPNSSQYPEWFEYQAWLAEGNAPLPSVTLEGRKAERLREMTAARNATLSGLVVEWDGDLWDANEETSNRIANALSMIREAAAQGIPTPPTIPWRTADNQDRVLTVAQLTQMGAAVFQAQQVVWAKQASLKNAIAAAQTVAAVEAVVW
jgi:hypothetical protein